MSSSNSATSAMSSSLRGGDDGGMGVDAGALEDCSRARLRAGDDYSLVYFYSGTYHRDGGWSEG